MPGDLTELISRPWAVVLLLAAAFTLPLLAADALRGGDAPRSVSRVTTAPAAEPAAARIPDLRPAAALPRLETVSTAPAAPAAEQGGP